MPSLPPTRDDSRPSRSNDNHFYAVVHSVERNVRASLASHAEERARTSSKRQRRDRIVQSWSKTDATNYLAQSLSGATT
jgi:hypothetical protein